MQHATFQTVAVFSRDRVLLPAFELIPRGIMQKIGDIIVHQSIHFASNPDFSHRYQSLSPNEEKTRKLFSPALLTYVEGLNPAVKWRLEGLGDTLVVYRAGKTTKPGELRGFLGEAASLARSVFDSSSVAEVSLSE